MGFVNARFIASKYDKINAYASPQFLFKNFVFGLNFMINFYTLFYNSLVYLKFVSQFFPLRNLNVDTWKRVDHAKWWDISKPYIIGGHLQQNFLVLNSGKCRWKWSYFEINYRFPTTIRCVSLSCFSKECIYRHHHFWQSDSVHKNIFLKQLRLSGEFDPHWVTHPFVIVAYLSYG